MNKLKKMIYTALLTAMAIIIPLTFGFAKVVIGPFSATLASHVPLFIAMFLGPFSAVFVGLGSALGFLVSSTPVVAARALMHAFVGLAGAYALQKGMSFRKMVLFTAVLHGALEAVAVMPFGFTMYKILVTVGIGSVLHHLADGAIAAVVVRILSKSLNINLMKLQTVKH